MEVKEVGGETEYGVRVRRPVVKPHETIEFRMNLSVTNERAAAHTGRYESNSRSGRHRLALALALRLQGASDPHMAISLQVSVLWFFGITWVDRGR